MSGRGSSTGVEMMGVGRTSNNVDVDLLTERKGKLENALRNVHHRGCRSVLITLLFKLIELRHIWCTVRVTLVVGFGSL